MLSVNKLLMFIPAITLVLIASCSGSKKLAGGGTIAGNQGEYASQSPEKNKIPTEIFEVAEVMPKFPGGKKALKEFINTNIKYPQTAKEKNIQGKVYLKFCIKYDGSVTMAKVVRGLSSELDQEALRIIRILPSSCSSEVFVLLRYS